jgi:hypothetical protein
LFDYKGDGEIPGDSVGSEVAPSRPAPKDWDEKVHYDATKKFPKNKGYIHVSRNCIETAGGQIKAMELWEMWKKFGYCDNDDECKRLERTLVDWAEIYEYKPGILRCWD